MNAEGLKQKAAQLRRDLARMIGPGVPGHLGGSASIMDILTALYYGEMNHRPEDPSWPDRDRLIFSKGHAGVAQYVALADCGYFPKEDLATLKQLGSRLQGHPDMHRVPLGSFPVHGNDAGCILLRLVVKKCQRTGQDIPPGAIVIHHGPGFPGADDQQHGALFAMPHHKGFLALLGPQGGIGLFCGGDHRQQLLLRRFRIPDQGGCGHNDPVLPDQDGASSQAQRFDAAGMRLPVSVHPGNARGHTELRVGLGHPGCPLRLGQVPGSGTRIISDLNGAGFDGDAAVLIDHGAFRKSGG